MTTARFSARKTTRSAGATRALGEALGRRLRAGDVVALVGDLGAGKTQLVRGACAGAGVPAAEVSSPSFAIVATYHGRRLPVHHADLYRIGDEDELYGTGFGDLVGGEGAILVEWADRIPGALPEERVTLTLAHDDARPNVRHVAIDGVGERHAALARDVAGTPARAGAKARAGSRSRTATRPGSVDSAPTLTRRRHARDGRPRAARKPGMETGSRAGSGRVTKKKAHPRRRRRSR